MNKIIKKIEVSVILLLVLVSYFVPIVYAADPDASPPTIDELGSHTRTKSPGYGLYCKLIKYNDQESGIFKINISGTNVDGTYPDIPANLIVGNERTWNDKPKKIYIDVCYKDRTKPISVTTTARNGDGFDTTKTFNNPAKPTDGLLSYGVRVKSGQNAYLVVYGISFGDVIAGSMAYIANSFGIGNTGDATASVDMQVNSSDSMGRYGMLLVTGGSTGTYGAYSTGTETTITADNMAVGNLTTEKWVYLNETGNSTYIGDVPPGGYQNFDAKVLVPPNVVAGNFNSSVIMIFGTNETAPP